MQDQLKGLILNITASTFSMVIFKIISQTGFINLIAKYVEILIWVVLAYFIFLLKRSS